MRRPLRLPQGEQRRRAVQGLVMFERYSEPARRVIFFARYEAVVADAKFIESKHLLLGVLREDRLRIEALQANLKELSQRLGMASGSADPSRRKDMALDN